VTVSEEASVSLLTETLGYYPDASTTFAIELMKSRTASGAAKTGKIYFVKERTEATQGTAAGMSGLGAMPGQMFNHPLQASYLSGLGAVQQAQVTMFEDRLVQERSLADQRQALANERGAFMLEKTLFERDKATWEENKKETERELLEKQKVYESRSESFRSGTEKAIEKYLMGFVEEGGKKPGIAGVQTQEEPKTPGEQIIEEIAGAVDEKVKEVTELRTWGLLTHFFLKNPQHAIFTQFRERANKQTPEPQNA